jgi:hypothetical protein
VYNFRYKEFMSKFSAKQLKVAGLIPLLIPIALLLLFTVAETVGGDISGLGHLIMLAPLLVLAVFAWKKPDLAGKILVVIGVLLAILGLAQAVLARVVVGEGMGIGALIGTGLVIYVPIITSGLLFRAAARKGS